MGEGKKEILRQFSSGGVVFKGKKDSILWLVTRSAASDLYPKQVWRLPKGWIDEGETMEDAALREIKEEGGVEAKIIKKIETVKYFFTTPDKSKILKFVTLYLTEWVRDLPEGFDEETSEIAWLSYEEAHKKLSFSGERQVLKKAKELQDSLI
jgi:8-oxo-dGTP pyrophosphatase MutT (NUDIX family)